MYIVAVGVVKIYKALTRLLRGALSIPLLGIDLKGCIHHDIHCSTNYNSQDMEAI